jgi:ribonuclease III
MTLWRSEREQNQTLARVAASMKLGKCLRLGEGTKSQGGRSSLKILSGALEAIIGAYFFDSGMDAVQQYIKKLLPHLLTDLDE